MLFNTIILHKCEGKVLTSQTEPINLNQLKPKNNKPKINQKRKRQVHVIKASEESYRKYLDIEKHITCT